MILYFELIDGDKQRFYRMCLLRGLWGEYLLEREWGRLGHRPTRRMLTAYETEEDRQKALQRIVRRRERHGYVQKETFPPNGLAFDDDGGREESFSKAH